MLFIAHKSLYDKEPIYLKNLLSWYSPGRDLRPDHHYLLNEPSWNKKTFGARRFEYAVPHLWNNILPLKLRQQTNLDKFMSELKTCLFKLAYPDH